MSVDRSVPTPPPTVTGQSPREESFVVSVEAVEKAARAGYERVWRRDWTHASREDRDYWLAIADALILAALPVIERDLRETIAQEIEADLVGNPPDRSALPGPDAKWDGYLLAVVEAAARVREGGRP